MPDVILSPEDERHVREQGLLDLHGRPLKRNHDPVIEKVPIFGRVAVSEEDAEAIRQARLVPSSTPTDSKLMLSAAREVDALGMVRACQLEIAEYRQAFERLQKGKPSSSKQREAKRLNRDTERALQRMAAIMQTPEYERIEARRRALRNPLGKKAG